MIDWLSLFTEYRVEYHTSGKKVTTGWLGVRCYTCDDRSGQKLGINIQSGGCSCWSCGSKKTLDVIENLLRVPHDEARRIYRKYIIQGSSTTFNKKRTVGSATKLDIPNKPLTEREIKYLKQRGIGSKYFINTYEFSSGGIVGDFAHRIVIPIYYRGEAVSATARTIHKDVLPKYWTLPPDKEIFHHKSLLMGWDDVKDFPILVEGPIDAIKGGPGFVSSFGAQLTEEQLLLLSTKKKVYTLFDGDSAGRVAGNKYAAYLDVLGVDVEMLWLKKGHDTGEKSLEEIDEIRNELGMDIIYE